MNILQISPSHLSDGATLPWEIPNSHFRQCYSYIILLHHTKDSKDTKDKIGYFLTVIQKNKKLDALVGRGTQHTYTHSHLGTEL